MCHKSLLTLLAALLITAPIMGCKDEPDRSVEESLADRKKFNGGSLNLAVGSSLSLFPNIADPESAPSVEYVEDAMKLDLDIAIYPERGYLEQLNGVLASDDPLDLVHLDSSITISKYVKDGLIMPLDDLLQLHAPDLLRMLPEEAWDAVTFEGKIYAIPSLTEVSANEILYGRKDWLDSLQLDPPRTLEEYDEVMRAFTYDDPDGNSINDTWGLTIVPDGLSRTGPFFGAFGVARSANQIRQWKIRNGDIIYSSLLPETFSAIEYLAKLYGAGILDRDFVLNNENTYVNKIIEGKVGIYSAHWDESQQIMRQSAERNPDVRWIRLDYPVGKDGQQGTTEVELVQAFNVIPVKSRQAEKAVKLLNFIAGEGHSALKLGGENWGLLYALADRADPAVRQKKLSASADGQISSDNADYALKHVLRSDFTGPTTPSMHRSAEKLMAFEEESFIKIIMGVEPEKDFEDFSLHWVREGGWEISNEVNAWFRNARRGSTE